MSLCRKFCVRDLCRKSCVYVAVREQHAGVYSFSYVGHWYQIQIVKLGYKPLTTDPSCYYPYFKEKCVPYLFCLLAEGLAESKAKKLKESLPKLYANHSDSLLNISQRKNCVWSIVLLVFISMSFSSSDYINHKPNYYIEIICTESELFYLYYKYNTTIYYLPFFWNCP